MGKSGSSVRHPADVALKPCTDRAAAILNPTSNLNEVKHHHQRGEENKKAILVPIFAKGSCPIQRWISNLGLGMWPGSPGRLQTLTVRTRWEHPDQQRRGHEQSRIVLAVRGGFGLEFLMAAEQECCRDGPDCRARLLSL